MQKTKKLLTLLLIIFLSSCKDQFPAIKPQIRCVNVFLEERIIDGVQFNSGYCRCHLYEWSMDRIGRVSESEDYPMSKCNKLIGFEPDTYVSIYTWWESIRLWLNRHK
jgi:hypothetical protein